VQFYFEYQLKNCLAKHHTWCAEPAGKH